jgi:hypothetical protein
VFPEVLLLDVFEEDTVFPDKLLLQSCCAGRLFCEGGCCWFAGFMLFIKLLGRMKGAAVGMSPDMETGGQFGVEDSKGFRLM